MKITFKPSWHTKIAQLGDFSFRDFSQQNICSYTRCFLKGLLIIVFGTALGSGCIAAIVTTLQYYIRYWLGWINRPASTWEATSFLISGVLLGITAFTFLIVWLDTRKQQRTNPTFIARAYTSWKEKTCIPIVFDHGDK